jgi:hypothetical protein
MGLIMFLGPDNNDEAYRNNAGWQNSQLDVKFRRFERR